MGQLILTTEASAPSTPAAGKASLYVGSDKLLRWKDADGKIHAPASQKQGQSGVIVPRHIAEYGAAVALAANFVYVARFILDEDLTISSVAFGVTTAAGSNDACDVGFYDSTLATKLSSVGATTGKLNATGVQTMSIAQSFTAGTLYHAAFSVGTFGTTGASLTMANIGTYTTDLFGTAVGVREFSVKAASHPIPSSLSGMTAITAFPVLALRV